MAPLEYLGVWGTLIHEKNLKSKISCQTPFNKNVGATVLTNRMQRKLQEH
jgi:hypothetical protein